MERDSQTYAIIGEEAQIINNLKATGLKRFLLINFGDHQLSYKRFVV
ncbi:MAG: hypothetical protein P4L69_18805 [Desulfosporosinus sp.]|nr:hypothetical protein [Desulfosporosinus sp.]